jgi:hypothetical protein
MLHTLTTPYSSGRVFIWHSPYINYSLLIRKNYVSDILHKLFINYSSGRAVHLAFSIHYLPITHQGELCIWHYPHTMWSLLIRARCVSEILHTLNTHLWELCTSHSPYTNYSLLIRKCCVSDTLHTLITQYSLGRVCMWHSPYINYSLLVRESCVSDILHSLITPYSSGKVMYLTFSIH